MRAFSFVSPHQLLVHLRLILTDFFVFKSYLDAHVCLFISAGCTLATSLLKPIIYQQMTPFLNLRF